MGTDTPISALSNKAKLLYTYFKQNFAQVTNPPIDPIREELVMSLVSFIGPRPNILDLEGNARRKRLEVRQPILTNEDLEKIRCIGHFEDTFDTKTIDITYAVERGVSGMEDALARISERARGGRGRRLQHHHPLGPHGRAGPRPDPVPPRHRRRASSPDPQGPAHIRRSRRGGPATRAKSTIQLSGRLRRGGDQSVSRLRNAGGDGWRVAREGERARCGQAFHQVGRQGHFEGDVQDGHLDLSVLLRRADFRRDRSVEGVHRQVFPRRSTLSRASGSARSRRRRCAGTAMRSATAPSCGARWRSAANMLIARAARRTTGRPETVSLLQHAVRGNAREKFSAYSKLLNDQSRQLLTIRGLFRLKTADEDGRAPVPLDEVESAVDIVKRFSTGAMSLRLDLARGAYDARHRDEPHRRQVQHRRGRRGERPLQAAAQRRLHAQRDQTGGLGPLRSDCGISRQFRHDADQDGAKARSPAKAASCPATRSTR